MKKFISVVLTAVMLLSVAFAAMPTIAITGNDSGVFIRTDGSKTGILRYMAQIDFDGYELEEYGMKFIPLGLYETTESWAQVSSTNVSDFSSGDTFTADLDNISASFLDKNFIAIAFAKFKELEGYIFSTVGNFNKASVNQSKNLGTKQELQCDENGDFKILIVSDIHGAWDEAKANLETLIKQEDPDFLVINGDTKSPHSAFSNSDFEAMLEPVLSRGIPWTATNGNHDPYDADRWEFYKSLSGFVGENVSEADDNYDSARPTNFMLPIYKNDGKTPVFAVWAMDTGTSSSGKYEGVTDKQIAWYKAKSAEVKEEYGDLTGLMLLHIPPTEMIDLYYSKTEGGTAEFGEVGDAYQPIYGGIYSTSAFGVADYTTDTGTVVSSTAMNATHPDNNRGVFSAMKEMGNIDISVSGHDHANNFIGVYKGIMMGFAGRLVGETYSRGARVIKFNQKSPKSFTTKWIGLNETSEDQPEIESDGYKTGEIRNATSMAVIVTPPQEYDEEDIYIVDGYNSSDIENNDLDLDNLNRLEGSDLKLPDLTK